MDRQTLQEAQFEIFQWPNHRTPVGVTTVDIQLGERVQKGTLTWLPSLHELLKRVDHMRAELEVL